MISAPTENERAVTGMAEYIEREALRDALYDADAITMSGVKILNQFPASGVAPVRHGRWICINKSYGEYECSVCHGVDSNCSDYYGTHVVTEQEYCPNCGAVMEASNA